MISSLSLNRCLRFFWIATALFGSTLMVGAAVPSLTLPGTNPELDDDDSALIFTGTALGDSDGHDLIVTVTFDSTKGGFAGNDFTLSGTSASRMLTLKPTSGQAPAAALTDLLLLSYTPVENRIAAGETENLSFVVSVDDGSDATSDTLTVELTSINDLPTITLPGSNPSLNDNDAATIFSAVSLDDDDAEAQLDVVVTYDSAKGSFTSASLTSSGFVQTNATTLTFTADNTDTPATAQTALRALVFDPTENQVEVGSTDTLTFNIEVTDDANAAVDKDLLVDVLSINDAPVVNLPGSNPTMDDDQISTIFSGVTLTEVDVNDDLILVITYDKDKGSFISNTGPFNTSGTGANSKLTLSPALSRSAAQSALQALVYEPLPNQVVVGQEEDLEFSIEAEDESNDSDLETLTLEVTSVNDVPTLTNNGNTSNFSANAGETTVVFPQVDLEDPDVQVDSDPEIPGDDFIATVELSGGADPGSIESSSFTLDSGFTYTFTGKLAEVQSAIREFEYLAPSVNGTFTIELWVEDVEGAQSNILSRNVTVTQPTPGVSGLLTGQQVADNVAGFTPFSTAIFNSFGAASRDVIISLDDDAKGTFEILGDFTPIEVSGETVYKMTGTSVQATASIQNLRFIPTENRIVKPASGPFEEDVTFTISVRETGGSSDLSTDILAVTVVPINDAPGIASDNPEIEIDDDDTATPFASTVVSDMDEGGAQEITVTVTVVGEFAGIPGTLSSSDSAFVATATDNVYRVSGTPSAVNTILQSATFTPTANRNQVGIRETVEFNLQVSDGEGGSAQSTVSFVTVFSVNGAPVIAGVPALSEQPFPTPSSGPDQAQPFAGISVSDETDLTLVISLDFPEKGTLTLDSVDQAIADDVGDDSLTIDFDTVAGTYELVGTDAAITSAIQGMTYTLTPVLVDPGSQTFTLLASDAATTTSKTLAMFIRDRNVAHIVTSAANAGTGSLREAIELSSNGDFIVFEFDEAAYPVTIYLESTLQVEKDLTIVGSGVSDLALSGAPDAGSEGAVGIFYVTNGALLTLEQLTLKDGAAPSYGGAVSAENDASLIARYCSFEGNSAGQFGGAIDIYTGELRVEQCLFVNNFVAGTGARAGGAISIATTGVSSIVNSTFVGNRQDKFAIENGGGAIHADNIDEAQYFDLTVEHCTFVDNVDAANSGTAILASSEGASVWVRNNIFADQQGRVLDVIGNGRIESLGGNIATDATATTYTQGGSSQNISLLDADIDSLSVPDPLLLPLGDYGGPTLTCPPDVGSPAIDEARVTVPTAPETIAIDQKGAWRDTLPDIGAYEVDAFERVNINEIQVDPDTGDDPFIEFYVPRGSTALNLENLSYQIDDLDPVTFGPTPLDPGAGHVVNLAAAVLDQEKGTIRLFNSDGQELLEVNYMASFVESGSETGVDHESITRYPRFEGAFLPHLRISELVLGSSPGLLESPGDDVNGAGLNGGNAHPIAIADVDEFTVFADQTLTPDVLANDLEFDLLDSLKIEEVMVLDAGVVVNDELLAIDGVGEITLEGLPASPTSTVDPVTVADPEGVVVTISPDGTSLTYDPTGSDFMIALSQGETSTDIWAYTILDYVNGVTPQARGADDTEREDNIVLGTSYFTVTVTGVNEAPEPVDDSTATDENQAIRILADVTLINDNPNFDFGDLEADYQEFDSNGNQLPFTPPPPSLALLDNDDDIDNDDDNTDLLLVAVHTTATPTDLLVTTSELGARVVLDIRAEREETNIVYDPRESPILNALSEGETITDTFYYSVFDSHGARGVAKVSILVTGVNDVPTATDDSGFVTDEDNSLDIAGSELLSNDIDPDQDANGPDDAPVISDSGNDFPDTSDLGAALDFDGTTITYDPRTLEVYESLSRNETIEDSFIYTLDDLNGGTSQATVTILVQGRNDAPVAQDDALGILENDTVVVSAINGLLSNDEDVDINGTPPDDQPWIIPQRDVISPLGAELDINPDGSYRYDANSLAIDSLFEGEIAIETFPYIVIDNFRTTAMPDTFKLEANPDVSTDAVAVGGYFADEADASVVVVQSPNHGLTDGSYVEIEGYDGGGDYNGVHVATIIDADSFSLPIPFVDEEAPVLGNWRAWLSALPILLNDEVVGSVNSLVEAYTADANPERLVVESENHSLRNGQLVQIQGYSGDGDYNGAYPVTVIDRDFFSIAVPYVDDPAGARGTWRPWLELTLATDPDQGGRLFSPDGQLLLYTPTSGFYGIETFSYTIGDGVGGQDVTDVQIEVTQLPLNGLLTASPDIFRVGKGESSVQVDVLINDYRLPSLGSELEIIDFDSTGTGGGSLVLAGQSLVYSPVDEDFTGSDSFNYTVSGGGTSTAETTVTFEVVDRTDQLSGSPDDFFVVTGMTDQLLDVLANDADLPSFPVVSSLEEVTSPTTAGGTASIVGDQVSYTPPASPFIGGDSFTYVARDASGATTTQTVRVQVVDDETNFYAKDDFYRVVAGSGPIQLTILDNDGAVRDETAVLSIEDLGIGLDLPEDQNRVEIINEGSAILYTPPAAAGTEDFNYEISVGTIDRREAKITIEVVDAFATQPAPLDDFYMVAKNSGPHALDVLLNDIPYPDAGWEWTIDSTTAASEGGSVEVADGSALSYTPQEGFFGTETIEYTIIDAFGATAMATVTITVGELLTESDAFAVLQGSSNNKLPVLANDDLLNRYSEDYTITDVGTPDAGGVVSIQGPLSPNNALRYTPLAGFTGTETFTYTVEDQTGLTRVETVTVEVLAQDSDRDTADLTVTLTGINDITQIGSTADGSTTDKLSVKPFPTITITDLDEFGLQILDTTLTYDASFGTLSAPSLTALGGGNYSFAGTPAQLQTALREIVFTPYENFIDYIDYAADNSIGDVDFTLSVDDRNLGPVLGDSADAPVVEVVTINVEPINDAPTLVSVIPDLLVQVNSLPRARQLAPRFADVDDDIAAGELTWTVVGNTNPSIFSSLSIDPVKQLIVFHFATDAYGQSDITIRATDRGGLFVETTFNVTVDTPPMLDIEDGEIPVAAFIGSQDANLRVYRQSFRVNNNGVLVAEAFIIHVSGLEGVMDVFEPVVVTGGQYSIDEKGTPDIFTDDIRSSVGVSVRQKGTYEFALKHNVPLQPDESRVVHISYTANSLESVVIEPAISIELTTATPEIAGGAKFESVDPETGDVILTFSLEGGKSYLVQSSLDLNTWNDWGLVIPSSDFDREVIVVDDGLFTDPHPASAPQRFYRLVQISVP